MFLNAPGNPGRLKKGFYIFCAVVLGLILSLIVHAIIEMSYLSWALRRGMIVPFYGNCALPPLLRAGLAIGGGAGGFFLGRYWWRKVYIERVWAKARGGSK